MLSRSREPVEVHLVIQAPEKTRTQWASWLEPLFDLLRVYPSPEAVEETEQVIALLREVTGTPISPGELQAFAERFPGVPLLLITAAPETLTVEIPEGMWLEVLPAASRLTQVLPHRVQQAYAWYRLRQRLRLAEQFLHEVQQQLSVITHDLNNPVAIISGNAQLLLELGKMMELEAEFLQSLSDIEEASLRIAQHLRPAGMLKHRIQQFLRASGER